MRFPGPLDLSVDKIRAAVESGFTINHVNNGQKGVADFAIKHMLTDEDDNLYICTDTSRYVYKYKGTNGEIVKDSGAAKLTKAIYNPIKDKASQITTGIDCDDIDSGKYMSIMTLNNNNTEFCSRLAEQLQS
jgi:hypothetical protein